MFTHVYTDNVRTIVHTCLQYDNVRQLVHTILQRDNVRQLVQARLHWQCKTTCSHIFSVCVATRLNQILERWRVSFINQCAFCVHVVSNSEPDIKWTCEYDTNMLKTTVPLKTMYYLIRYVWLYVYDTFVVFVLLVIAV